MTIVTIMNDTRKNNHPQTSRTCANPACGAQLTKRANERVAAFALRKFCSQKCHYATPSRPMLEKCCKECGWSFERRIGQSFSSWGKQEFCSRSCRSKFTGRRRDALEAIRRLQGLNPIVPPVDLWVGVRFEDIDALTLAREAKSVAFHVRGERFPMFSSCGSSAAWAAYAT